MVRMTAGNYNNCAANGFPGSVDPFEDIRRKPPEDLEADVEYYRSPPIGRPPGLTGSALCRRKWCRFSPPLTAEELTRSGHPVSSVTVGRYLEELGYTLQLNVKAREGPQHENRDAQFRYLNRQVKAFRKVGDPVISVDTKKKELVGAFKNRGRRWLPRGMADRVSVHDFPEKGKGKAIPYGAYDIARNRAVVNVGVTHDTAEFAVESIRRGGDWTASVITGKLAVCSSAPTEEAVMEVARARGS